MFSVWSRAICGLWNKKKSDLRFPDPKISPDQLRFAIYVYKKKETPRSEDLGVPLGEQICRESSTSASLTL